MATPTKITTQSTPWGITGSPERVLDRAPDGTLWWSQNEGDDAYFWYSKDQGSTWSYSGGGSDMDYLSSYYPRAFHIDAEGYGHSVGRDNNTELIYGRGTPGSTGKTWSWKTAEFDGAGEALAPDGGLDLIAFRLGSGWKVFVLFCTRKSSSGVYTNTLRLTRLGISSSGTITEERSDVIRTDTNDSYPYGCLAFQHTGDGKTATATPHVYVVTSVNTPIVASAAQDDLHLVKMTYEAGAWTQGSPIVLESGVDTTNRTMRCHYDSTRLVTVYGTRNRAVDATGAIHSVDWTDATGVIARHDANTWGVSYPLGVSSAVDPTTDDIYVVGYGVGNSGLVYWSRFVRATSTWTPWTSIITASTTQPGRVSMKQYVSSSAIELVLESGSGSSFTDYYLKLTSINLAPTAATLVTPASSSVQDLGGQGAVFSWRFNDPDPGDTQGAWQMRRRVGTGAYSYYSAATQTWGATAVWNSGSDKSVSFGPGVWTNGSVWSWSINTQDAGGLASGFAPDALVTASTAPVPAVTSPLGIYALDSSPVVTWSYTGANSQRTYQIKLFDLATYSQGGFDPATATPLWDSGDTSSVQARSTRTGANLLNGGTYRAYMRVSDSLALYSGWVYGEFLLVLTPAPAPLVEAAVIDSYESGAARVRLSIQGLTNMLSASQAYDHADNTQWENDANTTVGNSPNGVVAQTNRSLMMTSNAAGDMRVRSYAGTPPLNTTGAPAAPARDFAVTTGQTYTALASFTAATTPRNVRVTIRWYRTNDTLHSTVQGVFLADMVGYPVQAYVQATCPLGVDRARIVLEVLAGTVAGEIHYVDAIDFHPGLSTVYSPGGLTDTQTFTVTRWLVGDTQGTVLRTINAVAGDDTQRLVGYDREMPFGQPVEYTAQAVTILSSGQALASDLSLPTQVQVDSPTWALRDPLDDAAEIRALVIDHKTTQDELSAAYHPAGRNRPLVESEGVQGEDGTATLFIGSYSDRQKLRSLLIRSTPLLLQSPAGDAWYIRLSNRKRSAIAGLAHQFDLDYVEVDAP